MKLKYIIPLVIFVTLFTSCQPETQTEQVDVDHSAQVKSKMKSVNQNRSSDQLLLQNRMQWASFITAKALMNVQHRTTLKMHLNLNQTDYINLNDLIGDNPINDNFRNDFINLLAYYFEPYVTDPDPEKDKPGFIGGGGNGPVILNVDSWFSYWLDQNCLELYFPNHIIEPTGEDFIIESTAHSLSMEQGNIGITRYSNPIPTDSGLNTVTLFTDIDSSDLLISKTIVVTRPIRRLFGAKGDPDCSYSEYNEIDFSDFLDN